MQFPRYVRTQNLLGQPEWLVRNLNTEYTNDQGETIKTPVELLNRYYRHCQHLPLEHSVLQGRMYLTYGEIPKNKNTIEYDGIFILRFSDLTNEEILNRQFAAIVNQFADISGVIEVKTNATNILPNFRLEDLADINQFVIPNPTLSKAKMTMELKPGYDHTADSMLMTDPALWKPKSKISVTRDKHRSSDETMPMYISKKINQVK